MKKSRSLKLRSRRFVRDVVLHTPIVKMIFILVVLWLLFAAGLVVMFWIIGRISTPSLAAANVLVTVLLFAILPGLGMGLACATLVGQALGKRDANDAYQWGFDVAKLTVVLLAILGMPMWLAPDLVLSIFIHEESTRELARWPMRIMGLTMPIEAIGFAFMHGLLGAGDARREKAGLATQ